MARTKQGSKRKRRRTALVLGAAGVSFTMAGSASATAPATNVPSQNTASGIVLVEEEISDVSLATFYVFDKENKSPLRQGFNSQLMAAAAEAAAAAEVAAAAGVMAAAAEVAAAAGVMAARPAVARLMAALAMAVRVVAARVAAAEAVGAAAAAAVALVYGLAAAGAAPETTQTAGNGIQLRASGSPSAINGKSGRFRGWPRKFAERYDEVRPELQPFAAVTPAAWRSSPPCGGPRRE